MTSRQSMVPQRSYAAFSARLPKLGKRSEPYKKDVDEDKQFSPDYPLYTMVCRITRILLFARSA